jgi:tripartite-type tricarboxylate transporter receptor subunit TctC
MGTSLMSGETQSAIATIGSVLVHIRSNKLRPLGVAASVRSTILPNVPTIAESGLPGYDMRPWIGAFAPAKTPKPIVDRLGAEMNKIMKKPEMGKLMLEQGLEPWAASQQEFVQRMHGDFEKYQKIFRIIGAPTT